MSVTMSITMHAYAYLAKMRAEAQGTSKGGRRVAAPDSLKSEKKSDHDSDLLDLTREPRHATGVGTACQKSDSGV